MNRQISGRSMVWIVMVTLSMAFLTACALPAYKEPVNEEIRAIEVGKSEPTPYSFQLFYDGDDMLSAAGISGTAQPVNGCDGFDVEIRDSVPAEWDVVDWEEDPDPLPGSLSIESANKKGNNKSATKIVWDSLCIDDEAGTVTVHIQTRERPGNKYAPTSCGALYANTGVDYLLTISNEEFMEAELDEIAEMLQSVNLGYKTIPLCLAAVEDLNGDGIVEDGTGDEDGDGCSDYDEACIWGTDPCNGEDFNPDCEGVPNGPE
jgi:hypothetical protein